MSQGEGRFRWFLRETMLVVGANLYAIAFAWICPLIGVHISTETAPVAAAVAFVGLSVVNTASARAHARSGQLVNWVLLMIYEGLAAAAAWSWLTGAAR